MSSSSAMAERVARAIEAGDVKQVTELIADPEFCVDAELPSSRVAPTIAIVLASVIGDLAVVQVLLRAGANINTRDSMGSTPCHVAVQNSHAALVAWLVANGADVAMRDLRGHSALFFASSLESDALSVLLIESGAPLLDDPDAVCRVAGSSVAVARLLLARHVNLRDLRDSDGRSAVYYACQCQCAEPEHAALALLLRDVGVDPSACDNGGRTPAHACAVSGCHESLRRLIDCGADVDRLDNDARSPLHNACARGFADCVFLLIAAGADVHVSDCMSQSVCHHAVMSSPLVLCAVLAAGADFAQPDRDGCTPRELSMMYDVAPPTEDELAAARRRIGATRLALVRERALQVCVGLGALDLDALRLCEILVHACGSAAPALAFHQWWQIATAAKHFRQR
jgi:ankyrin repeat protein